MVCQGLLQKDFVELYKTCQKMIALHNEFKRIFDGQLVETVKKEYPEVLVLLLGGVLEKEDGSYDYSEKSMAKFSKEILGFYPISLADLCEKYKLEVPLDVELRVEDTDFIKYVKTIKNKVEEILYLAKEKGLIKNIPEEETVDIKNYLKEPSRILELVKIFLQNLLNILPNYNEKSFLIWTTEMIIYRYLVVNYPQFKNDDTLKEFSEIFGYESVFIPEIQKEDLRKEYTIYAYKEESLGKKLREFFLYVWENWGKYWKYVIGKFIIPFPSNPLEDFKKIAKEKLQEVGVWKSGWNVCEEVSRIISVENYYKYSIYRGGYSIAKYYIKGSSIYKEFSDYYATTGNYYPPEEKDRNLSLFRILDEIMPFIFFYQDLEIKLIIEKEEGDWVLRVKCLR